MTSSSLKCKRLGKLKEAMIADSKTDTMKMMAMLVLTLSLAVLTQAWVACNSSSL